METTHSHHLEIHSNSVLSNIRPEIKIATTFIIVLSIAFLSLEKNSAIIVQTFVVLLLLYLSKIKIFLILINSFSDLKNIKNL